MQWKCIALFNQAMKL